MKGRLAITQLVCGKHSRRTLCSGTRKTSITTLDVDVFPKFGRHAQQVNLAARPMALVEIIAPRRTHLEFSKKKKKHSVKKKKTMALIKENRLNNFRCKSKRHQRHKGHKDNAHVDEVDPGFGGHGKMVKSKL